MDNRYAYFATCPRNTGDLAAAEIETFGGTQIKETPSGVAFSGSMETGYRHILWSRISNRLFFELSSFPVSSPQDIYNGVREISWEDEFSNSASFTIISDLIRTDVVQHPNFAAQKMKDAIVDQFRENSGIRPAVDNKNPDITLHLLIKRDLATVSIDLSGMSMHRRGYRIMSGSAPLKENVAAALLLRSGWDQIARNGGSFLDGFCGTGTLLIEAAMIAGDRAPGLLRNKTGLSVWKKYDSQLWDNLKAEALKRWEIGSKHIPGIVGFDKNRKTVSATIANIEAAGLSDKIHAEKREFKDIRVPHLSPGLMVSNPPYGERMEETKALIPIYKTIGKVAERELKNWKISILSGNIELSRAIGLKPEKINIFFNGPIECTLASFRIFTRDEKNQIARKIEKKISEREPVSPGAEMFANRLKKNIKKLRKWASKNMVTSYRIYDADMPEYAAAIDYYEGKWINLQEYAPPKEIEPEKAEKHRKEMLDGLLAVLPLHRKNVFIKLRKQQPGKSQYEKIALRGEKEIVHENGHKFLINLSDYLDTGIFLDHRITRELISSLSKNKDFLNLFAYTGTATVYAAAGGARTTKTVDKSNTYLGWAEENMKLNGYTGSNHMYIKADCLRWIETSCLKEHDLIFLDPPTFSNSKSMIKPFAIQKDYKDLIEKAIALLRKDGILLFSTNYRKFRLDSTLFPDLNIEDISEKTIPADFERNKRIHYCWKIGRK